jgi:hypothetical protein
MELVIACFAVPNALKQMCSLFIIHECSWQQSFSLTPVAPSLCRQCQAMLCCLPAADVHAATLSVTQAIGPGPAIQLFHLFNVSYLRTLSWISTLDHSFFSFSVLYMLCGPASDTSRLPLPLCKHLPRHYLCGACSVSATALRRQYLCGACCRSATHLLGAAVHAVQAVFLPLLPRATGPGCRRRPRALRHADWAADAGTTSTSTFVQNFALQLPVQPIPSLCTHVP